MAAYIYYYYFFFHFPRQLCLASKYFESRSLSLGLRFLPHAFSSRPSLFNEHLGQRFFFFFCLFVSTASRRFVLQLIFSLSLPSFFLALSSWAFLGTMNRVKGAREKKKKQGKQCAHFHLFLCSVCSLILRRTEKTSVLLFFVYYKNSALAFISTHSCRKSCSVRLSCDGFFFPIYDFI